MPARKIIKTLKARANASWRRFLRLQRLLITSRSGVISLVVVGGTSCVAGVELFALGLIDFTALRVLVYFALGGAGLSFSFLYLHYSYATTLAHTDVLTGLSNRKAIISAFKQYRSLAQRESRKLAVIYMDLDSFKPVNDQYGHDAGDELLRRLANVLQMTVRESDIVARIGGDEFLVLMTGSVTSDGVRCCVKRLREATQKPVRLHSAGDTVVTVAASIGMAIYPDDATDVHTLAEIADRRMFEDKRTHHDES